MKTVAPILIITAILLGLMLVFEPKERDIMRRPPHPPQAALLDGALVLRIGIVSVLLCVGAFGLYEWQLAGGGSEAQARTLAVTVFIVGEAFYLLNCRSLTQSMFKLGLMSNPWIWAGVATMLALQVAFAYVPVMNVMFGSAPLSAEAWALAFAWGLFVYMVVGLEKAWRRRIIQVRPPAGSSGWTAS